MIFYSLPEVLFVGFLLSKQLRWAMRRAGTLNLLKSRRRDILLALAGTWPVMKGSNLAHASGMKHVHRFVVRTVGLVAVTRP